MKEHSAGLKSLLSISISLAVSVICCSAGIAGETETAGWKVNQETIVNFINLQSRRDAYDYAADILTDKNLLPVFQSLEITSPEVSGFSGTAGITQLPLDYGTSGIFHDYKSRRLLQARASYSSSFENGSVNLWLGALWQEQAVRSIATGIRSDDGNFGYNFGIDLTYAGISLGGSYFTGQGMDSILEYQPYYSVDETNCMIGRCTDYNNEGYMLKGAYAFTAATKLGIRYGESSGVAGLYSGMDSDSQLWSIGVYHDVNSWLKIVAKYNNFRSLNYGFEEDTEIFSLGGSIRW